MRKTAAIITTGSEVFYGRIQDKFTPVICAKLEALGVEVRSQVKVPDDREQIISAIQAAHESGVDLILCTGGIEPDRRSIEEAASLAAYYSQGREGGKVPVDYTPVKFVKKPAGGKPGMVVYTTYQTIYAVPDEALARRLSVK